jgi:hypothetical protein
MIVVLDPLLIELRGDLRFAAAWRRLDVAL